MVRQSSLWLFIQSLLVTLLRSLFVSCRQGRHVRHQLPRMDAGVASLQPEHPLLWYATCPSSFKTYMCAAELIVFCYKQSCWLA